MLPRLIGLQNGLDLLLSSRKLGAAIALVAGPAKKVDGYVLNGGHAVPPYGAGVYGQDTPDGVWHVR